MKIFMKTIKIIFIILAILLGFFVLHNFLGRVMFKNDYPTLFGYGYASVKEDTADKKYKLGDLVIIKKQEYYEVGDYIIYLKIDTQVIEQIKEKTETGYITIETVDNDEYEVNRGFVKAKVHSVLKMGSFSAFLTSTLGLFVVLFLFILLTFTPQR